jgi:hypothetical protein
MSSMIVKSVASIILPIHSGPQYAGALESYHFPGWQSHRFPSYGIPPYTLLLLSHGKFPKSADENVFAVLQGLFYQLEKGVDDLGRLKLCENIFGEECFHDLGFGESHWWLLKNEREILLVPQIQERLWESGNIPH